MIEAPSIDEASYIRTSSGILLPPSRFADSYVRDDLSEPGPILRSILNQRLPWYSSNLDGFQEGYSLEKDPDYGFLLLPEKGSGWDDIFSQAVVDGRVANVGISPIISSQMSAVLLRQQAQARNAEINLIGRPTPLKKAKQAISWYNDSPLGFPGAIAQIVYQMRVFNRGAPHSLVPIMAPFDKWEDLGLYLLPIDESKGLYYLDVDWAKAGGPVPYLPSVFDLEPTTDCRWPYWYRVCIEKDKHVWVLLNQEFVFPLHMGFSGQRHVGTSSVYLFWDVLTELSLEKQRRAEMMIHQPSHGLLALSGITQSAGEVKKQVASERVEGRSQGRQVDKGLTVITSKDHIDATFLRFRESFADFVEFRQAVEDIIAQVFGEPLTSVVTRGNVGFGVQSETSADVNADSGVQTILSDVAAILGACYPRVTVSISRPNDYMKRRQLENLKTFSDAVGKFPEGTLSIPEVRAMMQNLIVEIPEVEGQDQQSAGPEASTEEPVATPEETQQVQNTIQFALRLEPIIPKGANQKLKKRAPDSKKASYRRWDDDFPVYIGMLDAVSDVDDPDHHDGVWMWHHSEKVFHYPDDNRKIDREETLDLKDELRDKRSFDANDLAGMLASGLLTLQEWLDGIKQSVEDAYLTEECLGNGGYPQIDQEGFEWLDETLTVPFLTLDDLADRIAQGLYSEAQIASFTRNTIMGSGAGYEIGNSLTNGVGRGRLPAIPGDGSSECQTNCHCWWSFNIEGGMIVSATWNHPPISRRIPGWEPCDTCNQRIREWAPYVFSSPIPASLSKESEEMLRACRSYGLSNDEIDFAVDYVSGLHMQTIADRHNYTLQTSYNRLHSIQKKLKKKNASRELIRQLLKIP